MIPRRGNDPPAIPLSPSQTLEGLFELTRRHSRALALPRALLQRYKTTVRCVALGAEVTGHRQKWLSKPRLYICRKRTILHRYRLVKK